MQNSETETYLKTDLPFFFIEKTPRWRCLALVVLIQSGCADLMASSTLGRFGQQLLTVSLLPLLKTELLVSWFIFSLTGRCAFSSPSDASSWLISHYILYLIPVFYDNLVNLVFKFGSVKVKFLIQFSANKRLTICYIYTRYVVWSI